MQSTAGRIGLLSALGLLMMQSAIAQLISSDRYPWDRRPEACFSSSSPSSAECTLDNWPDYRRTLDRLKLLHKNSQYALLDKAIADIVLSNKKFPDGSFGARVISAAILSMFSNDDKVDSELLANWRTAVPKSYFLTFVEAEFEYSKAWRMRGRSYSGSVSQESWDLFNMHLQKAERILLAAPSKLKDTPLWYHLLISISSDTDQVESNAQKLFNAAIGKWPNHFEFYEQIARRLQPKWGGSWEQLEAFINASTQKTESSEGKSYYARLYIRLLGEGVTPDQTLMDWKKMKVSLVDLVNRYPRPIYQNRYPSYACFAKDKQAFGEAMRIITPEVYSANYWLPGHSREACLKWAGI